MGMVLFLWPLVAQEDERAPGPRGCTRASRLPTPDEARARAVRRLCKPEGNGALQEETPDSSPGPLQQPGGWLLSLSGLGV